MSVIFMCVGVPKVHQQSIAQELSNVTVKTSDNLGANLLIRPYHVTPVFWVELGGQFGRVHQISEHDRQLPSFSFWRMRGGAWDFARTGVLCQAAFLLYRWLWGEGRFHFHFAS